MAPLGTLPRTKRHWPGIYFCLPILDRSQQKTTNSCCSLCGITNLLNIWATTFKAGDYGSARSYVLCAVLGAIGS